MAMPHERHIADLNKTIKSYQRILFKQWVLVLFVLLTLVLFMLGLPGIIVYAESKVPKGPEYRIRRTFDEEAGVVCWTAYTETSISIDCMLLKHTKLKSEGK